MIYEPRRSFLRSASIHVPIQPSMRCLSVDINQTQNPASVQAMSISQKFVCGYLISIYFSRHSMALRACTYVLKKEKSGEPAGNTWTATIAPGGPTGLRPVCVFFVCVRGRRIKRNVEAFADHDDSFSLLLYDIWTGTCFFFCAWVHRRRIQRTLPAPAFSASHSTPLDVLRCTAFDVWTRGSPSPLPISTSVSSTFSLTHSPLRIAIPLVPTVRHSLSILIMSHGELPPPLSRFRHIYIRTSSINRTIQQLW